MERGIDSLLAEHPFFKGMDAETLALIAGCGKNVKFEKGKCLAREGEKSKAFYAIRAGRVIVEVHGAERGAIAIESLDEGDILGWSWLFPPYRWIFDARAVEPTRAVMFDAECLRKKCDDNPVMGYDLMKRFARVFAKRIEATRLQLMDLYGKT